MARTPWQWLEDWQRSDLTNEQASYEYIRTEMQNRYPGNYTIVRNPYPHGQRYVIKFDTPQEETMYRLRWT